MGKKQYVEMVRGKIVDRVDKIGWFWGRLLQVL